MDALRGKIAKIMITRHAVERLLERKPREYRKISGEVIANIVGNIVCSGKYLERTDEEESAEEGCEECEQEHKVLNEEIHCLLQVRGG